MQMAAVVTVTEPGSEPVAEVSEALLVRRAKSGDLAAFVGMLDDVLILALGDFGRTPIIGTQGGFTGGRNHWKGVMSAFSLTLRGSLPFDEQRIYRRCGAGKQPTR